MSKTAKIIIFSVIGVLLAVVFLLIILENVSKNKFSIVNNTDKNITSLNVIFETEEEGVDQGLIYEGPLNKGEKVTGRFDTVDFSLLDGDIGIYVTFEGYEEIYCYDGMFSGKFDGKVDLEFYQSEGEYRLKSNASVGLFNNTDNTQMENNEIFFDLEEEDWDYIE